jgi:FkbM family methyltransferase
MAVLLSKKNKFLKLLRPKFIYSLLLENITSWFSYPINVTIKTFWGENMVVVIPESVSIFIHRFGFYEEGLSNIFMRYLKPGMTFFDVGAHFGYYTLLGASLVDTQGQVHSFEPTPSSYNILKTNVSRKTNIRINNKALFSEKKDLLLKDYGIRYSAFNTIYNSKLDKNTIQKSDITEHIIEGITLDDYVESNSVIPDFIKIDAEGSEYDILVGGQKTIEKYHPLITIEVGDTDVRNVPKSKELIEYLIGYNYQPYNYVDGNIKVHSSRIDSYRYDNILFVPNSGHL